MNLFAPIPAIRTGRLVLRAPAEADFPAVAAFMASDRSRFIGGPMDADMAWRGLLGVIGHWAIRGYGFFSVDTHGGDFVGRVGVICHHGWPEPELAWQVFAGGEGKGYAAEAATAARDHAAGLGLGPLMSMIDPDNGRSRALAERLGARMEREWQHPKWGPVLIYRHPPGTAPAPLREPDAIQTLTVGIGAEA